MWEIGMTKTPQSKYRKITRKSVEDDYEHNLWRAVEDMWVEMYAEYEMPPDVIKEKILFFADAYCQFLESEAQKDLHRMSARKKRLYK